MQKPIPMILTCPSCGARHIDEGDFATKPHHTHACQSCGMCWRPAVVATCGVRFLPGFKNDVVRHLGGILGNIDERTMHHAAQRAQGESEVYRATLPELHALRAVAEAASHGQDDDVVARVVEYVPATREEEPC